MSFKIVCFHITENCPSTISLNLQMAVQSYKALEVNHELIEFGLDNIKE